MAAVYPSSLKTFTIKTNKVDLVDAAHINDIQNEVSAIETELGTDPAGSCTDLKTRLYVSIGNDGAIRQGTSFPGSPITGQAFYRSDEDTLYIYDGSAWDAVSVAASQTLFAFTGCGEASAAAGFYTGATELAASSDFAYWVVKGTTTTLVLRTKFKKIAGVSTITFYAYVKCNGTDTMGQVNVRVNGGSPTGPEGTVAIPNSTKQWVSGTVDVTSLSNGTTYELDVRLRADDDDVNALIALYSIVGIAS